MVRSKNALGTPRVTSFLNTCPSRRKKNAKNGASSIVGSETAAASSASAIFFCSALPPNSSARLLISAWKSMRCRNANCFSSPVSVRSISTRPPSR